MLAKISLRHRLNAFFFFAKVVVLIALRVERSFLRRFCRAVKSVVSLMLEYTVMVIV
jgi:hypothetical protein